MSVKMRFLPGIGFRHGPLSRRVDRIEAWARLALLLVFLMITPPATWFVGEAVCQASVEQERVQQADRHQVSARLLETARVAVGSTSAVQIPVTAEWTEQDGSQHRGVIRAAPGAQAGSIQTIWTDASGNPVPDPVGHDDTITVVTGAVLLVIALIGSVAIGVGVLIHRRFDRHRLELWAREWQQVGPEWSRRW